MQQECKGNEKVKAIYSLKYLCEKQLSRYLSFSLSAYGDRHKLCSRFRAQTAFFSSHSVSNFKVSVLRNIQTPGLTFENIVASGIIP